MCYAILNLAWVISITLIRSSAANEVLLAYYNACIPNPQVTFDIKFTKAIPQKLNITMEFPYDIDDSFITAYQLHSSIANKRKIKLMDSVDKRGPCKLLSQLLGPLWRNLQSSAGINNGNCPFTKGKYTLTNYDLDYTALPARNLPHGKIMFKVQWKRKVTNVAVFCGYLEVESR